MHRESLNPIAPGTAAYRASSRLRRLLPLVPLLLLGPLLPYLLATTTSDSLARAIEVQRVLVEDRPGDGALWSDLGNLLALAGELEAAEQAYLEALRLAPDLFDAHYNLGLLLLGEERHDAAASHLREAAELDPGSAWARYQLGSSQRALGRRGDAIRAYAEAFRLDPRLAFSDVNPDVILNPWLTESLLHAHRKRAPRGETASSDVAPAQVASVPRTQGEPSRMTSFRNYGEPANVASSPRSYSEPERIAELLVPHSASSEAHSLVPHAQPRSRTTPVAPAEPAASAAERHQLELVPSELEQVDDFDAVDETPVARDLGRAAPASSATSSRSSSAAPGAVVVAEPRRRVGPEELSGGGRVEEGGDQLPDDEPEPAAPVTRFRPGRRSSAQLDLMLLPRGAGSGPVVTEPGHAAGARHAGAVGVAGRR